MAIRAGNAPQAGAQVVRISVTVLWGSAVSALDECPCGLLVVGHESGKVQPFDLAVPHFPLASDHDAVRSVGTAQQQGGNRIMATGKSQFIELEQGEVSLLADRQFANVRTAQQARRIPGRRWPSTFSGVTFTSPPRAWSSLAVNSARGFLIQMRCAGMAVFLLKWVQGSQIDRLSSCPVMRSALRQLRSSASPQCPAFHGWPSDTGA